MTLDLFSANCTNILVSPGWPAAGSRSPSLARTALRLPLPRADIRLLILAAV